MAKKNKQVIDIRSIYKYTTADRDEVMQYAKKNRKGLPLVWPIKNGLGKRIILSFVDAYICDKSGKQIEEQKGNFDILEQDSFDAKDPNATLKLKFINALLSPDYLVQGGVYYKGKYFTYKMDYKEATILLKSFLNNYFHLEDGELVNETFKQANEVNLPFYPTKSIDGKTRAIFSAVNATIKVKGDDSGNSLGNYNFHIHRGDLFNLNKKEDMDKAEVIFSLLSKDRVVSGFYYKGVLLPDSLEDDFKAYLEKSFVKKNFSVDDRDYLFTHVSKDQKSGFPIFWPMNNKKGRPVIISVVNASGQHVDDEDLKNFDVFGDEKFDLREEHFQKKLEVIKALYYNNGLTSGALYLDGILCKDNISNGEREYRKGKCERALNIYINNSRDFSEINKNFNIDNREELLNLSSVYDNYYPGNKIVAPKKDKDFAKGNENTVRFDNVNAIDHLGKYILKDNISTLHEKDDVNFSKEEIQLLKAYVSPNYKVRGALFFNGKNVATKNNEKFISYLREKLNDNDRQFIFEGNEEEIHKYALDKKYGITKFWPTRDENDREVLLSVIDADIRFKNGRNVVKAVSNATFDIYEGETFGLVGESGSGKTTISRAILGINKLAKGGIYYKGKLISSKMPKDEKHRIKKNIQMIFQDPAASLNERANIDYIVSEGLYNFHMFKSKEERVEKVVNMLGQVGLLPEHLSRYPHEFSGGQRQRIGIARALVIEPQLVLADEPISALDVSIRAQVLNLMKKLQNEQKLTYLFIAHDLSIIRYISDRIAVMHNGFIVELGPADEIYQNPLHPYTQSLLTAIPQPDPKTKNERKKIRYEQGSLRYEDCRWEEISPKHFVLVNDEIKANIEKRLASKKKKK